MKYVPRPTLGVNTRLSPCKASTLRRLLGEPSRSYSSKCTTPTNPKIKGMLVTKDISPIEGFKFRVTGLAPAVKLLELGFDELEKVHPGFVKRLGSAGMTCSRFIRGSSRTPSNHSWGTAIDFTLDGILDAYGDGMVQADLFILYSILKNFGFFWGVSFSKEDGMHFELADETVRVLAKLNWEVPDDIQQFRTMLTKEAA